jgi:hypothetical protein
MRHRGEARFPYPDRRGQKIVVEIAVVKITPPILEAPGKAPVLWRPIPALPFAVGPSLGDVTAFTSASVGPPPLRNIPSVGRCAAHAMPSCRGQRLCVSHANLPSAQFGKSRPRTSLMLEARRQFY